MSAPRSVGKVVPSERHNYLIKLDRIINVQLSVEAVPFLIFHGKGPVLANRSIYLNGLNGGTNQSCEVKVLSMSSIYGSSVIVHNKKDIDTIKPLRASCKNVNLRS